MKVVFVSNYLNHHQLPFCKAMLKSGIDFHFIATEELPDERRELVYEDMNIKYDFVVRTYESEEMYNKALQLCDLTDVAIIGSAPVDFVKNRTGKDKLTYVYFERIYKKKCKIYKLPIHFLRFWKNCYRRENFYLLCSSAFTSADFAKTFTFMNKAYKWGYFPEVKKYDDMDNVVSNKEKNSILWAGRFIDYKHPEMAVEIAHKLKEDGYKFSLSIIGTGEKEEYLKSLISDFGLENEVKILGSMSPEKVRENMEKSEIYLFTSDRGEGWGAVLNESMNSGCAIVASHIIGSVPFLISDGENGMIYKDGDIEDLFAKVKFLMDNPQKRAEIGKTAYKTLCEQWNADNAAKRLIKLSQEILKGNKSPEVFDSGVCSKAKILKDNWY